MSANHHTGSVPDVRAAKVIARAAPWNGHRTLPPPAAELQPLAHPRGFLSPRVFLHRATPAPPCPACSRNRCSLPSTSECTQTHARSSAAQPSPFPRVPHAAATAARPRTGSTRSGRRRGGSPALCKAALARAEGSEGRETTLKTFSTLWWSVQQEPVGAACS